MAHLFSNRTEFINGRNGPGRFVIGNIDIQLSDEASRHVTAAMLATLEKRRKVILVGDMVVGKTPMTGAAIGVLWHEGKIKPGQVGPNPANDRRQRRKAGQ